MAGAAIPRAQQRSAKRSPLLPFALATAVTVLIGVAVSMEPYFAGDIAVTRAVQRASPEPSWWATPISRLAPAPIRYYVMGIAALLSFLIAGWPGLAIAAAAIALDQFGAEATKAIVGRPRPSRELIKVVGNPSGFSFPSTTITFFCATFGTLAVLSARKAATPLNGVVLVAASLILVLGCVARVALGLHWPSDVALTSVICLTWLWATARVTVPR
ncbi:MAG: phosphatase PAP2 family protein [Acidobacteriota bacterium]|nr:phosphatase PAP2 family protein [Acidobacteriota bacterium]